jgi:hypothetical protein
VVGLVNMMSVWLMYYLRQICPAQCSTQGTAHGEATSKHSPKAKALMKAVACPRAKTATACGFHPCVRCTPAEEAAAAAAVRRPGAEAVAPAVPLLAVLQLLLLLRGSCIASVIAVHLAVVEAVGAASALRDGGAADRGVPGEGPSPRARLPLQRTLLFIDNIAHAQVRVSFSRCVE